jgi:hypothetical protein
MAAQLLALPALGKALAFAKGLTGLGSVANVAKSAGALGAFGKGAAYKRLAGDALAKAGTMVPKNVGEATKMIVGNELYNNKGQLIGRLAPDALFGVITGAMTEGDIGDKLIAGTASAAGGGLGGIALGRAGQKFGNTAGFLADMGGSIAGDMVGMKLADDVIRFKGGGMTPMEQKMMEQDALYRAQLEQEFLNKYGIGATVDPVMASNGLAA